MLATLLALSLQLDRDRDRPPGELRERDRAIGRARRSAMKRPVRALRGWIEAVAHDEDRITTQRAMAALRATGLLTVVVGLVLGTGAAAAVYSYDGSRPIDILPALAAFVVLPLLLLVPLLVQLLPLPLPGLATVRESLAVLGAGLFALAMRVLGQRHRDLVQTALGRGRAHQRVYAPLQKWVLLSSSQSFAVAFHLGAITWLMARVLVTDLSFTWSTTAEFVTAERVHALTAWLSTPWQAWLPQAVPSLRDVQTTQYFRLGEGSLAAGADPALLGRWWSFLLMSMVVYGLLPRLFTAMVCALGRARAERWTLLHLPGVDDALDRLTRWDVRTQADEPERQPSPGGEASPSVDQGAAVDGPAVLVTWSFGGTDLPLAQFSLRDGLGVDVRATFEAGAGHTLDHDARVLGEVATALAALDRGRVVVLVKAWEPATMEAMDFLAGLRRSVGDAVRIVVAAQRLTALAGDDALDRDVSQWRRRCTTLGDPWLGVVGLDAGADAGAPR